MATAWGEILSEKKCGGDGFYYLLAAMSGVLAAWVDIKVGDLLLTAMVVLAANMLLGILRPRKPWRWVLLVGVFVPVVEWLAYFFLSQKPFFFQAEDGIRDSSVTGVQTCALPI